MENFTFPFIRARMGTDQFFVKDVHHMINDGVYSVTLWLNGHERNVYREWLVDRALYTGVLHFTDKYSKHPFEIDKILLDWYRR